MITEGHILFKSPHDTEIKFGVLNPDTRGANVFISDFSGRVAHYRMFEKSSDSLRSSLELLTAGLEHDFVEEVESRVFYEDAVRSAVASIRNQELSKVVLARRHFHEGGSNVLSALESLFGITDAFVYALSLPGKGLWCGATPESLIQKRANVVNSMALAGTKIQHEQWSEKEFQEQKVVEKYLVDRFIESGLTEVYAKDRTEKVAGNLRHLCSSVFGTLNASISLLNLVNELHPTPALGGFPKLQALERIARLESFDRELYGGFIGFENEDSADFYVNIRCARIYGNGVLFFAGAGINEGSDPSQEWLETENKLSVLRRFFE